MADKLVRWLRHGQPVPEGWRVCAPRLDTNHTLYTVLIERIDDAGERDRAPGRSAA